MKILAFDTVTEGCSAALMIDDTIMERVEAGPNRHSSCLLPMIESLMADAGLILTDLDALAYDRGPGAFTGLRIGAGVAQGLAFTADIPVVGVSSLQTLAMAAGVDHVLAAIDARMGQVYWAMIDEPSNMNKSWLEQLDNPEDVRVEAPCIHGVGSGWDNYAKVLEAGVTGEITWTSEAIPQAAFVARLAQMELVAHPGGLSDKAVPVYLRDQVAKRPAR
ncbi:MAG: tRNA (adenosine(37)-N6)-threonylcarbamoyltransferase complex dimerization subunit type 1 TsaB [marine bacterium B5-7]|nr:MAG: tRNA (adenosine(37)-N6)-threonylcarbamoyltransferase complex dimerization subunit type 1 TsaB [marine bacterium B5-7]